MLSKKAMMAAPSAEPLFVESVFSTYLYTGNGSTQTITNGIDLAGKGGMVWTKLRNQANSHVLYYTEAGVQKFLIPNNTQALDTSTGSLTSYNSTGFTLGSSAYSNQSTLPYASWTFRKAPKFFDVVTYTGNGVDNRQIPHSLGSVPGFIIIKCTNAANMWCCYHISTGTQKALYLNATNAVSTWTAAFPVAPTNTSFTVINNANFNDSANTYVAYLFAHDAGGFGDAGDQSVVSCGSYTGNGSATGPVVTLGWEPQYLMIKNASGTGNWQIIDNMRGMPVGSADATLQANVNNAESAVEYISPTATGFQITSTSTEVNTNASTYIYLAIRRGPMKTPTDGTKVFDVKVANSVAANTAVSTTNLADAVLYLARTGNPISRGIFFDRLRGLTSTDSRWLGTAITNGEFAQNANCLSAQQNTGIIDNFTNYNLGAINTQYSILSRAPGFFDVVCYTGTGVARTVNHNLGVAPELMIVKQRNATASWQVYSASLGNTKSLFLNGTSAATTTTSGSGFNNWNSTSPTSTVFTVGDSTSDTNVSAGTYVAYLFASCPGVSKVGSYTGTGTTLQINCGFTTGARFVMIKRTDSTGSWYVWDTARGIIAGNDPYLLLNSTAAEVTNTDYVDALASGFEISSTAPAEINASGGSYIFLAIA